jgi:inositol phosphorylceramide mannosyltransferase catalytic subunit
VSLSICLITADPPERISTILEPLRPYADEVLIAADSRVDEQTLSAYRSLSDRLFKIEYRASERHLAWLCEQCKGSWIMRIDGDEVPSAGFVRRLPEMLASRAVQQFWTTTTWLYPDAAHALVGPPWSEDFACRLMRNDGTLRSPGLQHTHIVPISPREYVEDAFYHLDLLVSNEQNRRDKAIRYEISRPHLIAPNGGRANEAFYLPELRDALELRDVPLEDRALIERALEGPKRGSSTAPIGDVPVVSLEEMDRAWEQRTVPESAYRAKIEALEPKASFIPSEQRHVFFRVANEGTERWPGQLEERPLIRLSYRWRNSDGSVHTADGARSPFTRRVSPGEQTLTPMHIVAPADPGEYILEVDLVHEHVRWFDCPCRVPARVEPQHGLPATGARLRETRPPRLRRWRRVRIPRTFHRIWIGGEALPAEHEHFGETFALHHPNWEMRLWTDEDLPALDITVADQRRARTRSELANLMRYEVLSRFGGVYVDTDFECLRPLTPLLRGIDAFTALELPGRTATGILGSVPGHPVFARAARQARLTLGEGAGSTDANGPYFFSLILEQESNVAIFPARLFYPYLWNEPERRDETFPDAYAVHHWAMSWLKEKPGG